MVKRKYSAGRRGPNKYARLVGSALSAAMKYRGNGSRTKTGIRNYNAEAGVTNQYDSRLIYRKRRTSKRQFKKRRLSVRTYRKNLLQHLGTNQLVRSTQGILACGANLQNSLGFCFLGNTGAAPDNDFGDIRDNMRIEGIANNWRKSEMLYVQKGVLDVTLQNISASLTTTADIDVYTLQCRRDHAQSATVPGEWTTYLTNQQKDDGSAATNANISQIGMTPFQAPQFCAQWTILRKRKYLLSHGQSCHFQIHQSSKRVNMGLSATTNWWKGVTAILIVINGVYSGLGFPACDLAYSFTRTYSFKYLQEGDDRVTQI